MHVSSGGLSPFKKLLIALVPLCAIGFVVHTLYNVGFSKGYAPEQPIPFSHKIHAGTNNIPCMYCHSNVEKSRHATVPAMNVCMNCHIVVKADSPYIQKLRQMVQEKKEPFQWVKVHDQPDFVRFNHKRHVKKGIACETCHGDVKKMDVVKVSYNQNMSWCLDCHRGKTAPAHLARAPEENHMGLGIPKGGVAPTSCFTCHQ